LEVSPDARVIDGDTFALADGRNARMSGVDAFEKDQAGIDSNGAPVPLGQRALTYLKGLITPASAVTATGDATYGRPVVTVANDGTDAGGQVVAQGLGLPTPEYLGKDPARLAAYLEQQREAIAAERGAYAGQYQRPSDYRHQGAAAPMRGKIPMTTRQKVEYSKLLRDPETTPETLDGWFAAQGHQVGNGANILDFMRRNPKAKAALYFQQEDALDQPVLPDGPGVVARTLGALNEGIADTLGAPVDLVNGGLGMLGLPVSEDPFGGSASIRDGLHAIGIGQDGEAYAPRSTVERYVQSIARGVGQAALPAGGTIAAGARLAGAGAGMVAQEGGTVAQALRGMVTEAAARPGLALAGEAGGAVGAGVGGQGARDAFPGNPYADLAGQVLGGIGGGIGAGVAASARWTAEPVPRARVAPEAATPPVEAVALQPVTPMTIDSAALRSAASDASGDVDMAQAGNVLRNAADTALADGQTVTLHIEGKAIPITQPGMIDAEGQRWGAMPILSPAAGDNARLEIGARAMASEIEPGPSLTGPAIDEAGDAAATATQPADAPPPAAGSTLDVPAIGRTTRTGEAVTPEDMAALAREVNPEDVRPIPANQVGDLDEAMRANPGTIRDVVAPNERDALTPYRLRADGPQRRDPLDLVSWLRTQGGIQDQGGNLRAAGINNKARPIEFAKSEGFLGKLVSDDGMTLDEAAAAAHDAGYFPDLPDRPTVNEFLDAVADTHRGGSGRMFHPDDYAAIDDYQAARDQRYAVERAEQEGAPLAEDVGQPVDLADLDANQPPATAYEDLPSLAERAGNIDISKLESRGDIVRAVLGVHRKVGGFDAARRGVVSHAETEALASELNMTADDLLKRRQGQALNAEQALAARSILAKSADELVKLAGKAEGGSDADLAAFRSAWIRHVAIQEQVSGITAEAGRTLSQFRMMAKSKLPVGRIHALQIEGAGGRDSLEEAARLILDAQGTPGGLNQSARLALKPGLKDKLVELYYNSLLSGPATHAVNVTSNAMTAGLQLPEHLVAAGIGRLRTAFRASTAEADRVLVSEVGARATGLLQGAVDGLKAFAHTAITGDVPDYVTKVEAASQEAISGLKGKIARTPTRMLSAEDELFKAIARKMELSGLAVRRARAEGLRGPALRQRIAELNAQPTDEMVERSMDYARYLTFQKPLGKLGTLMTTATQHAPALKLIVPFVRTPTNILKFAAERSPAAPILKDWRADVAAGGARRDLAVARMAMGTGLGLLATKWAEEGSITGGGPADKNARALMLADGWQPYSLRIGDTYYSYQRLDPLASTLGVAADLVETSEHMTETQRERSTMLVTAAIIKNLSNKVWLSGITNIAQAIDDPERYAGGFLAQMGGGIAVPAIVAQTARVADPVLREARGPIDRVKSRIPGLSMSLPPKRNVWGEVITSEGGVGPDIVSPFRISTAKNDPIAAELLRLEAGIGAVPRKVAGRQLSPMEYSQFQEVAGKLLRQDLTSRISDAGWPGLSDEERAKAVDDAKAKARKEARGLLFPTVGADVRYSTGKIRLSSF
jgi:endonuclease YncB( thermonuclease family)